MPAIVRKMASKQLLGKLVVLPNWKMKFFVYFSAVLLLSCSQKTATNSFENHIQSKKHEISAVIDKFRRSGYKKISFGPPDFLTIIDHEGKIQEIFVNREKGKENRSAESIELELEALSYIDQFEVTGIRVIEGSSGIYVGFSEGARLLIAEGDPEQIDWLLHGKPSSEVYPEWHVFFE